jgi:hypothetical protein
VFEALYTKWDDEVGRQEVPYSGGLQLRVLGAGAVAALARAVIECPIGNTQVTAGGGRGLPYEALVVEEWSLRVEEGCV